MNRVEQLTYDLLDGLLDGLGMQELQRLIAQDEVARSTYFAICEQEAALRGRLPAPDASRQTMARLRDALAGQQQPQSSEAAWSAIPAPPAPPLVGGASDPVPPPPAPPLAGEPSVPVPPPPAGLLGELPSPPPPPPAGFVGELPSAPPPPGFTGDLPCPPPPPPPGVPESTAADSLQMGATAGLPSSADTVPDAYTAGQAGSATPIPETTLSSPPAAPLPPSAVPGSAEPVVPPPPMPADDTEPSTGWFSRTAVSTLLSTLFHLAAMIALAAWMLPELIEDPPWALEATQVTAEEEIEDFEVVFLDERLQPATELVFGDTRALLEGASDGLPDRIELEDLPSKSDSSALERLDVPLDSGMMLVERSGGKRGPAQAVVDDYNQALDRITQEILRMLAKRKVLLVWCFDQSESMKDDQQEIIARIDRVYAELGMTDAARNDALLTMVTSFGSGFQAHTPRPTRNVDEIRAAINSVPIDPSGEEMMCSAVARSITMCRGFAGSEHRQMAMILVSDESGNQEESDNYLEMTIGVALNANCRVYVLGREAVFGSPYAHIRWVHPQTGHVHKLPVDRGPETAFIEQLQTEGFEARTDAHPSGFGPYAQSRLAWQTGGIFFLLPSLESDLVGGERLRYDTEAMESYWPNLDSRADVRRDMLRRPLRALIAKIVADLNPYQPEVAKLTNMRRRFPADKERFLAQAQEARASAGYYQAGLERGINALESRKAMRNNETSPRWQANYDLMLAQLVAYSARVHLYARALEEAAKKLNDTPTSLPSKENLVGWRLRANREVPVDEKAAKLIERSRDLYLTVIKNHPGTPWAARAEWELKRDLNYPGIAAIEAKRAEAAAKTAPDDGAVPDPNAIAARTNMGVGQSAGADASVDVDVAVGVGGGGGGGGGGGVGVGVAVNENIAADWGPNFYPGIEIVPEYRAPRPKHRGGGHSRPGRRSSGPKPARTPIPKL